MQIELDVADECEHRSCTDAPADAFVVTGDKGRNGVAVYCSDCAILHAQPSKNHTHLTDFEENDE